jgi:2-hydroxy-3-oxopropionate reductase
VPKRKPRRHLQPTTGRNAIPHAAGPFPVEDIGFIGLGLMGLPMANTLLRADPKLRLHVLAGRSKANLRKLQSAGRITQHKSLKEIAACCRVCITMLPAPADVEEVIAGESDSLLSGLKPDSVVIDCSTSSATLARSLDERLGEIGCAAVDSPVSGLPLRAVSGTLSLMVGARREVFERVAPTLKFLGTPTYMGPAGCGQVTKTVNQIVIGLTLAGLAEGILLGRQYGIDMPAMLQAVGGGLGGSEVLRVKGPNMIRDQFEPGFFLRYHLKDLNIALDLARQLGLSLPFTAQIREALQMGSALGLGELDDSAVLRVIEKMNGLEASKPRRQK